MGRLEYEKMESECDITYGKTIIRKGDTVIHVHIPQDGRLDMESVVESCRQAYHFWGREYLYLCHSWLLYPGLSDVLKKDSNILQFQKLYQIVQTYEQDREAEERIYIKIQDNPGAYPEMTSLQKRAKQYLLSGKKLGSGLGILKTEEIVQ